MRSTHPTSGYRTSSSLPRGLAALAAAVLTVLVALLVPAAPAAAAHGDCSGVIVVVDFGPLAEEPATGCADDPSDGLDALAQAGFPVTEVAAIRGMVCRIDALPETDCGGAPPADAYWSYWHAGAGDTEWAFSPVGGAQFVPEKGDVEGWAFGDGSTPPALAPDEAAASLAPEAAAEPDTRGSLTWLFAIVALAVITGLVVWRLRRDRRA